jgi:hypothetical protein
MAYWVFEALGLGESAGTWHQLECLVVVQQGVEPFLSKNSRLLPLTRIMASFRKAGLLQASEGRKMTQ